MDLFPPFEATIAGALAAIRDGRATCRAVLEACLDRIDDREDAVRAWVVVDRDGARRRADRLDRELAAGRPIGPLGGIPLGVKDIIDVEGLPTARGVPDWPGEEAARDAPIVAELRRAGAVILGKTASTPYAWIDPPPTRNPWDLGRTPGGSSSGSAAAVACGMCLGALGSQTGGSITRPASYCGVAGFKPTYGSRSLAGILPLAPSLDHPGPIARTVGDLALMAGVRPALGGPAPVLGLLGGPFEERAEPAMRDALAHAAALLAEAGLRVVAPPLPAWFAEAQAHHSTILAAEAAAFHRHARRDAPERYPPRMAALVDDGLGVSAVAYLDAMRFRERFRSGVEDWFCRVDALLTPAALGPAPGPTTTGDPAFNSPWSLAGLPTITHPAGLSADGLPLGLQLVGRAGPEGEAALFGVAARTEAALRRAAGADDLPDPPADP